MIIDTQTTFSGATGSDGTRTAQAIAATTLSTNVLDTRNSSPLASAVEGLDGEDVLLLVQVMQAFNNLTSLTITLESDSASSLASAPVVHYSKTFLLAQLVPGVIVRAHLTAEDFKRFVGVRYTVTGTNPSQGSVFAQFVNAFQRNTHFPKAFSLDV